MPTLIAPRIKSNPWVVLLVLTLGFFMILLDTTVVNVAVPDMENGLHAGFDQILWVLNGYILVYAVLLITAGRLGDMLGPKRLFMAGLVLFTLASAASGLSQNAGELILFRALQGVGGALLTPQTLAILPSIFPPERRGAAFGVWGAVMGLAAIIGPTLGGLLVTDFGWQSIFFINVPIGALALVASVFLMPEVRSHRSHQLDLIGVVLASAGLLSLVYALVEGQTFSWGPITSFAAFSLGSTRWSLISIYSLILLGGALLATFVWWETHAEEPLLPLSLFSDRNFSASNLVGAAISFTMAGMFLPITIFLQSALGMSAVHAGLTMVPMSLAILVGSPLAGRLSDVINGKYLIMGGVAVAAVGMGVLIQSLSLANTTWNLTIPFLVIGLGMGFVFAPLTTLAMRDVNPAFSGAASGFLTASRQVSMAMGSAVIGSVLATGVARQLPLEAAQLASRVPASLRHHFLAGFQTSSHGALDFGAGQTHATLPPGTAPAVMHHLALVGQEIFGGAFLAATRPSLLVAAGALVLGVMFAVLLRGGHSAEASRAEVVEPLVELAG